MINIPKLKMILKLSEMIVRCDILFDENYYSENEIEQDTKHS